MNVELKTQLQEKYTSLIQSALIRRVLKNSGYLFSASGVSAALSLLQGILLARLLGVEQFGLWGTITLFTGVVNNLASFRMDELVIKYVGQFTEMRDVQRAAAVFKAAAGVELASSLVAYGLIWLLAPLAALYLAKDQALTSWFLIYGLVVLFNLIFESSNGLLRIFDQFRNIALINIIQSVLALLLTAFAFVGTLFFSTSMPLPPLMIVILIFMVSKLAGALGMTWLALREAAQHWGNEWWKAPLISLRGYVHELGRFAVSTNLSASII
jgi:O-antigen/teichoic acid export membrane protein